MIFEEDFVHERNKRNIMLSQVVTGDEIFAYDIITNTHIWTRVIGLKKGGEKDLVNIILKNTHHLRMTIDQAIVNKRNEFETIKDIAFEVVKKEGFYNIRTMNDGDSELIELKKYGKFSVMQLEVENVDNNFYVNGVLVKSA